MKRLLILRPGSVDARVHAQHGDFDRWFCRALGPSRRGVDIVDPQAEALPLELSVYAAVLVTGSHAAAYDEAPWIRQLEEFLRRVEVPMLGVCFGHQVLATAFGGKVEPHPAGSEVGTVEIELRPEAEEDGLFAGTPRRFLAASVHDDHVVQLPPRAEVLAANDHCEVQAYRLGASIYGVQFHPEITPAILRSIVDARRADGKLAPDRADRLLAEVAETPEAASILRRFLTLAR